MAPKWAGIALFYDLKKALESRKPISVSHEIESVKILPPTGGNLPELYGAITEQAGFLGGNLQSKV